MNVTGCRLQVAGWSRWLLSIAIALAQTGCATSHPTTVASRRFVFERDTFAYANELVWEYRFDEHGNWTSRAREPKPDYTHHCFVMARSTKQFFNRCRFDPEQPTAGPDTYRRLIRQVVGISPRKESPEEKKIVIPGYANLREFSRAREDLLKSDCGGIGQSYFQHGHWRMIWPFSRRHQEKMALQLVGKLNRNQPAVIHLVRFPRLAINHAMLLFDAAETEKEIAFAAYDPNAPGRPTTLTYDRATRTFSLPISSYFAGGRVDVYEIYRSWCY